ncbi:MAG: AI-2E family transporter [Bacteroidales bacterium]
MIKKKPKISINLQEAFFFLLLILITISFFSVIRPFFVDIFLALVLSVLFRRPFNFFLNRFKGNKTRASIFSLVLVIFTIVVPVSFIGIMLSKEVSDGYSLFKNNWTDIRYYVEHIPERLSTNPEFKSAFESLDWDKIAESVNKTLSLVTDFILNLIQKTFINVGFMIVHFFIILFLLYYIFIDGKELLKKVQYLIPIKDSEERELFDKIERVIDAIIFNTIMIGIIEGSYGGILFAILGVPSPFFWGMIITFLSIIPIIGANSVLVPMAIYQFILGNTITAIIILIFGAGAIVINQNLIKPRLDGNKSGMHPAIVFISSMGGLILFGVVGFIAGPIITALFIVTWELFGEKYRKSLKIYNKE